MGTQPRYGNGTRGHRLTVDEEPPVEVAKYFDPEEKRQRRIGRTQATLAIGGAAATGEGTRRIVRETKLAHRLKGVKQDQAAAEAMAGAIRRAAIVKPKSAAIAAGGLAGLGATGAITRWVHGPRGRGRN